MSSREVLAAALVCVVAAAPASAQALKVESATARRIVLRWSGAGSKWIVERKSGAKPYAPVATVAATTYEDDQIGRYGIYQYRVRTDPTAAPSNEVVAGAPPAGVFRIAPTPKGADPDHYGVKSALAFDENGDPAVAFMWRDPNGDNDPQDNQVWFVRWDRAAYAWRKPVPVGTMGALEQDGPLEPIALAFDAASGTAAIAYPVAGQKGVTLAVSKDGGATWQPRPVQTGMSDGAVSTAMAIRDGRITLAANVFDVGPVLVTGDLAGDPASWKAAAAPVVGDHHDGETSVSLAFDHEGHPVVAYFDAPTEDDNFLFVVWRPDTGKAVTAVNTHGVRPDSANVRVAAGPRGLGLMVAANLDEKDDNAGVFYSSSADGATWSQPVKLPIDGPRSSGSPFAVTFDSKGAAAVAFGSPSGGGEGPCGYPEVDRSADGAAWKTCGVGHRLADHFLPLPDTLDAAFAGDDTLYVLFNVTSDESKYGTGVLLLHQ